MRRTAPPVNRVAQERAAQVIPARPLDLTVSRSRSRLCPVYVYVYVPVPVPVPVVGGNAADDQNSCRSPSWKVRGEPGSRPRLRSTTYSTSPALRTVAKKRVPVRLRR
jgi:hypothetical protein